MRITAVEAVASDLAAQLGQRLSEDRLSVGVAATLADIGEVGLVGLGAAGSPQRGQSQVSGSCASEAKEGQVS
jgi:hypothetical protein